MRREWWLAGAVVLTLAACSGGDDDTASTSTATTVAATTTAAPTTTGSTSTTSTTSSSVVTTTTLPDPTTTAPTTAPVSTTVPDGVPPRVTFPDDPDKQAVVDAAYAFFDAARAAQAAPGDESLRAALAATMAEPIAGRLAGFLDELLSAGERVVANDEQPSYLEVFAETVSVVEGSGLFDACVVDADVRVTGAAGAETVLDDDVTSGVQSYSIARVEGTWLVRDFATVDSYPGRVGCG